MTWDKSGSQPAEGSVNWNCRITHGQGFPCIVDHERFTEHSPQQCLDVINVILRSPCVIFSQFPVEVKEQNL
jgi:hypothetical protein